MILRILNLIFSILAIGFLLLDYFFAQEFSAELIGILIPLLLLVLNVLRLTVWFKSPLRLFAMLVNIPLILCLMIGGAILAINIFGAGFSGRQLPTFLTLSVLLNILFFISSMLETIVIAKKK